MTSFSFASFLPAGPEAILALSGMALLLLGVFKGDRSFRLVSWLGVAIFVIVGVLVATGIGHGAATGLNGSFIADGFGRFVKLIILAGAALTLLLSLTYAEREETARFEYPVLFLFASLGMMMMVSANDLLSLYLALELQNLGLYILAAVRRDSVKSTEAGLKYFVLSALSSGLLLYGISLVYGFAGTISFPALAHVFAGGASVGAIIGLSFVVAGLAFKIAAVPFHMWTPDVYEGAPTPVTAFFSVAPKAAALGLLVRVMSGPFGPLTDRWQDIVAFISIASMVLGAFAAIYQTNIKRLMAYSSISHIGYMLIGLAAGTEAGVRAIAIYLAIYLLMNVGTWGVILAMRAKGVALERIDDLKGLGHSRPKLALAMAVFMFAMAGVPPLAGFFGKLYVFLAAIQAGLYTLAVIGVLASVVAAFYYLHIVKVMYFDEPVVTFDAAAGEVSAIVLLSGLFVGFFFVWPQPVLAGAARAAHALFAG